MKAPEINAAWAELDDDGTTPPGHENAVNKENAHHLLHIQFPNGERAAHGSKSFGDSTKRMPGRGRPSTVNRQGLGAPVATQTDSSSAELVNRQKI
uniref:Uncharacterized protein n=1 Tax=Globodera rostochiensis TaxID=31243 RepID=A0A914HS39_GLORO